MARQAQGDVEREKKELEDSFQRVSEQAQRKVSGYEGVRGTPPWGTGTSNFSFLPAVSGAGRGAGHAEAGAGSQQTGAAGPPGHPGVQHTGESPWVAPATPGEAFQVRGRSACCRGAWVRCYPSRHYPLLA